MKNNTAQKSYSKKWREGKIRCEECLVLSSRRRDSVDSFMRKRFSDHLEESGAGFLETLTVALACFFGGGCFFLSFACKTQEQS